MKTNLYTDEYALRRVVERRVHASDQPVALFQDLVDLVLCPLAVTWWPAWAHGAPALRAALFLGTRLPACEPHGVARDVLKRIDDGHEAADQVLRTDHAVIDDLLLCLSGGDLSLFLLKE